MGNPQVLAVGFVEKNLFREYCYGKHEDWRVVACSLVGPEKKGVGVTIVICYGDDLWKSSLPVKAVEFGDVNPLGGGKYDDGNYGNVGFVDGRVACPILAVSEDESSIDEEGDAVNSVDGCDAQENEDAVTANIEQMNVSDQNEMEETRISKKLLRLITMPSSKLRFTLLLFNSSSQKRFSQFQFRLTLQSI
jgi:prepilin-type processing-associated H-X9-DG protein